MYKEAENSPQNGAPLRRQPAPHRSELINDHETGSDQQGERSGAAALCRTSLRFGEPMASWLLTTASRRHCRRMRRQTRAHVGATDVARPALAGAVRPPRFVPDAAPRLRDDGRRGLGTTPTPSLLAACRSPTARPRGGGAAGQAKRARARRPAARVCRVAGVADPRPATRGLGKIQRPATRDPERPGPPGPSGPARILVRAGNARPGPGICQGRDFKIIFDCHISEYSHQ